VAAPLSSGKRPLDDEVPSIFVTSLSVGIVLSQMLLVCSVLPAVSQLFIPGFDYFLGLP
jgi:hypothetical protein